MDLQTDFDLEFFDNYDPCLEDNTYVQEVFVSQEQRKKSCCFTGHRAIPVNKLNEILHSLKSTVVYLIRTKGVDEFHSGGALGFDTLAASIIIDLKRTYNHIKLILDLPYETQNVSWSDDKKRVYEFIKAGADCINYHSENPQNRTQATKALLKRNRILVDSSAFCVSYCHKNDGGTAYTVNYAKHCDLDVVEILNDN